MRSTFALSALLLASPAAPGAEPIESVCHLDGFATPVRCVTLEVPLDYAAPQGESIAIAAAVAPALTARPEPDPLCVFAGGPGQAGTDIGRMAAATIFGICAGMGFTATLALGRGLLARDVVNAGGYIAIGIVELWLMLWMLLAFPYYRKRSADLARLESIAASLADD